MGIAADIQFTLLLKQLLPPLTNLAREWYFNKGIYLSLQGSRQWRVDQGQELITNAPCPMPNAQCPMLNEKTI
ncbi:MAG: hypothetical protein V7L11_21270 [Nostoc sp.]|uniref:hypothetical protein n=1 Tax=Nostoc sp. TaxID=1180 RepID=UPI002FF7C054